ncbi:UMTA methyltransferase family protein [Rasamsonia emersonii CBS 393.64]|uniref:UMTA methyltransferase family protein n=1 Tax=Rasamsonia emersonii (strain ATCC 16479 / CBS 393.64 / IMI 116815) TaxID=1408163 RepID=A0A0F4YI89_RASE3|nr:UMTA methyltransferase family protein [Rasamsonia emersonii CBS 393.64]KKA18017.1 UMTA methyltransferase family protein [Rasamsonia emersonii CBS 393.64]
MAEVITATVTVKAYLLPNDEDESDRLDMVHEMVLTIMDRRLFFAPISEAPQRVLDLGTGTGIWAIDFEVGCHDENILQPAKLFIQVMGIDLSPNQPTINVAPGGWVEIQDWEANLTSQDNSTKNTSLEQYYDVVLGAFEKVGYVSSPGPHLEQWFCDVGFEDIHVEKYPVPLGVWPKDKKLAESGFESAAMAVLTRYEGWSKDEVTILVAKARTDAKNRDIHSLFHFLTVLAMWPTVENQKGLRDSLRYDTS